MKGRKISSSRQKGQGLVEFGLAAGVFLTLMWGILDIGRAVWYQSTLQDAVQEATRYAVVHGSTAATPVGPTDGNYSAGPPSTDSTLTNIVTKYAGVLNTSNISVNSSWSDGSNAPGKRITVTATYPFTAISSFFGTISFNISASSTRGIVN